MVAAPKSPPDEIAVKRSDPVYMAHSYLTKVPVAAIEPFIEAFSSPGDLVLDVFAGSGMTGVAAAMLGRRAVLYDVSVLGQHIGQNYVNLVDAVEFRRAADAVVDAAERRLGPVYRHRCAKCAGQATLSRRIWSLLLGCPACGGIVNYYRALEAASWKKSAMRCASCSGPVVTRGTERRGEEPVVDTVACTCASVLMDQTPSQPAATADASDLVWPDVPIEPHRQMFQASALSKNQLTKVASFFAPRNLAALAALRHAIEAWPDEAVRRKLMFGFTAILTRASKRYQWSRKRPLNAANQNYYVAQVFYEWNVFDLFLRKVNAIAASDDFIRSARGGELFASAAPIEVHYRLGSAERLDLADGTVDYVFTDPPFGSNIFYSDMNLFHEAWLGSFTDPSREAVVDRSGPPHARRTAERYEDILTRALTECRRVLKDDGRLSLVFSNSSGEIWALVQRVIAASGFALEGDGVCLLDKGQRSVKGLNSGHEDVVTVDLILTMRKRREADVRSASMADPDLDRLLDLVLTSPGADTPSRAYLRVVRHCLQDGIDLTLVSFGRIRRSLADRGLLVDAQTGVFSRPAPGSAS